MNEINASQLLSQLRHTAALAKGIEQPQQNQATSGNFSTMLSSAINHVNEVQLHTGELKRAFEMGDKDVSLAEVMIASQKAGIAFQGVVQVRNKLISSYQEIMSMQI